MGHKVHPYGFRIGINKPWLAKWYADRDYATLLQEDMKIRQLVAKQLANASVSQVEIERGINHVTVTIHTAKPGIVIGKGGANVEILRQQIGALTTRKVKLEIKEIRQPELDAYLVAMNIAGQLSRRIAFKKAMKQSIQRSMKAGAKGVKIAVAGRLGGSEMGRREWDKEGRIPLGTLRADISYGQVHAHTTYGRIGVKVWIYRGDITPERAAIIATPAPQGSSSDSSRVGCSRLLHLERLFCEPQNSGQRCHCQRTYRRRRFGGLPEDRRAHYRNPCARRRYRQGRRNDCHVGRRPGAVA